MMTILKHILLVLLFSAFVTRGQQGAAEGGVAPAERFQVTKDVKFLLYTKRNPSSAQTIVFEDHVTSLGNFNKLHETKLVIHGWLSSASKLDVIRAGYMAAGDDYNVIEVDWSAGASALYPVARGYVVEVGERVAKLLDALVASGLSSARLHLIGHSLGAHIAGVAANRFRGKVARVTGLDPAGPLFGVGESAANRLDISDAGFVDVIHTCAGVLGWKNPMGHADFFPNGGEMVQPGCNNDMAELGLGSCSHTRSRTYFAESITTKTGFVGKQCANWETYKSGKCAHNAQALMGEKCEGEILPFDPEFFTIC